MQNVERLLGLAIDFFLTELGERARPLLVPLLGHGRQCPPNPTRDRAASASKDSSAWRRRRWVRHSRSSIRQTSARFGMAENRAAGFSPQFLNRLNGLTGMFSNLSANEIFRDWVSRGVLGVTREDFQAWSDTRHPSAHGRLAAAGSQDELQTRVFRHARVQNLLNKILLQLMGYTGVYIDYAQPGDPPAEFPVFLPPSRSVRPGGSSVFAASSLRPRPAGGTPIHGSPGPSAGRRPARPV